MIDTILTTIMVILSGILGTALAYILCGIFEE